MIGGWSLCFCLIHLSVLWWYQIRIYGLKNCNFPYKYYYSLIFFPPPFHHSKKKKKPKSLNIPFLFNLKECDITRESWEGISCHWGHGSTFPCWAPHPHAQHRTWFQPIFICASRTVKHNILTASSSQVSQREISMFQIVNILLLLSIFGYSSDYIRLQGNIMKQDFLGQASHDV